jgi:hypothetical protein
MASDKRPVQRLDFPTPANFGEPTAYLTIAMNTRGECHVHAEAAMLRWPLSRGGNS